jgi:hypothetical protein
MKTIIYPGSTAASLSSTVSSAVIFLRLAAVDGWRALAHRGFRTKPVIAQKIMKLNRSVRPTFIQQGLKWCSFFLRILPASVMALPIALEAQHIVGAQYVYTITNGTVTINQYTGPGGTVTIPAVLSGLPVTSIGSQSFFYSTSLTNITIPDSVTSIGAGAFSDCTSLASVTMGTNVTTIGDTAFFNCTSLASLTIPNSVTGIGYEAFYGCAGLSSLIIPPKVTSVGSQGFSWCTGLSSVAIPNSLTNIGNDAFDSCTSLRVITVGTLNPAYSSLAGVLFNKSHTTLIQCPGAIAGTYAVPNGVTSIGSSAFRNCDSLNSITIPNSLTNIGASALVCPSLSMITVDALNPFYSSPDGILFDKNQTTLIQCPGARAGIYTIPSSVTNIVSTAFIGCSSLTAIVVDTLNPVYSSLAGVLFNKSQTTLVQCPETLAGSYVVPNTVTNIGDYAFEDCNSLTNVTLPNSVTGIGVGAFSTCTSLTNIVIPNSVMSIGSEAFEDCVSLSSVGIPNSVSSIGIYAFTACTSLTNVVVPNSVTAIADRTFQGCTRLSSVTIGSGVTNLGSLAFAFCPNLTSVYFKGNAPTADSTALGNDNATVYYMPGTAGWGTTFAGLATVQWNLQAQTRNANFGVRTNQFGFSITGPTNLGIVVEACTDLASPIWSAVQTNVLIGGSAYFSDPQWTKYQVRFYRIRLP